MRKCEWEWKSGVVGERRKGKGRKGEGRKGRGVKWGEVR